MFFKRFPTILVLSVLVAIVVCKVEIRREGWLDRVVKFHKSLFFNDVNSVSPYKIQAKIEPRPPGYKDSKLWNLETVVQLLVLIRDSEQAAPVRRAIRRAMRPSRRIMMSMADSFKYFPSKSKDLQNEFYYDIGSAEDYMFEREPQYTNGSWVSYNKTEAFEDSVIVVTNPVESRLPSAQISVRLLKDIMTQRAIAARGGTTTTTRPTISWKPMNKTTKKPSKDDDGNSTSGGPTTVAGGGTATPGDADTTTVGE
ncbi:uncharacterized protein LOC142984906 [Anticarsia gemmatalis]|uniref:uncharacterized protein LOC142984906 n=1 Tax=Anticarsia gemmatalis TaxID=129554 RepID=UPI003F777E09